MHPVEDCKPNCRVFGGFGGCWAENKNFVGILFVGASECRIQGGGVAASVVGEWFDAMGRGHWDGQVGEDDAALVRG